MRPNGADLLRGAQSALATYALPEIQTDFARTELMIVVALLGIAANDFDGAAQRLVDDNAALRALAARGADALAGDFAVELRALAGETDASVRISDLSAANDRLREAVARLAVVIENGEAPSLRSDVIEYLRCDVGGRALSLLGPRADG